MRFEVTVRVGDKKHRIQVNRIYEGDTIERFEISAGGKSVIFQTNYHYLQKNNKRKSADWKIISGEVENGAGFAMTIRALEHHFTETEKPPITRHK